MKLTFKRNIITWLMCVSCFLSYSQTKKVDPKNRSISKVFHYLRANNVFTASIGTAVMNGDYSDPLFEFYGQIGYKRYIVPHININFTYNKFNLAHKNLANNGFMSFDLNLEATLLPNKIFTPFVFAGGGFHASNYFKESDFKAQGGFGLECLVVERFGIKLFADYNYVFSDLVDGKEFGDANDIYWRIGLGINCYFGSTKKRNKIPDNVPTIINSNPIIHN